MTVTAPIYPFICLRICMSLSVLSIDISIIYLSKDIKKDLKNYFEIKVDNIWSNCLPNLII